MIALAKPPMFARDCNANASCTIAPVDPCPPKLYTVQIGGITIGQVDAATLAELWKRLGLK